MGITNTEEVRSVYVMTHEWCRKCDKVIEIMQKIQKNFDEIYTDEKKLNIEYLHSYDDFLDENTPKDSKFSFRQKSEQIYARINQKYEIPSSKIPFPTIFIDCPQFEGIYQNELTYLELQYWLNFSCFNFLPSCSRNLMNKSRSIKINWQDYQFAVLPAVFMNQNSNMHYFQRAHPFVKLCITDKNSKDNSYNSLELPQYRKQNVLELETGPLFFSSFDQNLRNYLFNPVNEPQFNKLAISIVFNSASHPKVCQFVQLYKFISDRLQNNKKTHINEGKLEQIFAFNQSHKEQLESRYHKSSIKNYDFSSKSRKDIFRNLVFVGACYIESKRDCIMKYEYSVDEEKGVKDRDLTQKPKITNYQIPYSFWGSKRQNLKRLMQFANVRNRFQDKSQDSLIKNDQIQIIAFHFDREGQIIRGYEFQEVETHLGNDFMFWLQNIYNHVFGSKANHKKMEENSRTLTCLSSEVVHVISERNLTTIQQNVKLKKIIYKVNELKKQNIKFNTIIAEQQPEKMQQFLLSSGIKTWSSEYFRFCAKDQSAKFMTFDEIINTLNEILLQQVPFQKDEL